jgi:hypothetical protein
MEKENKTGILQLPSTESWQELCKVPVTKNQKLIIGTWGFVVWSSGERVVTGLEHEGLHTGRAALFFRCIRECVKEHVDPLAYEGVPMELVRHVAPEVKDEL